MALSVRLHEPWPPGQNLRLFSFSQSDADLKTIKWLQILLGSEMPHRDAESFDVFPFIKAENLDLPSLKFKRIQESRLNSVMAITVLGVFQQEGTHLAIGCKWRRVWLESDLPIRAVWDWWHLQSFVSFSKVTPKAITRFLFGSITVYLLSV